MSKAGRELKSKGIRTYVLKDFERTYLPIVKLLCGASHLDVSS